MPTDAGEWGKFVKTRMWNGYRQFWNDLTGQWEFIHRRVEEFVRGPIPEGHHVHHINGDKRDNRPANLTALDPAVHRRLHHEDGDACFRCGRSGHWASDCYASTTFNGEPIEDEGYVFDDEDEDDDW